MSARDEILGRVRAANAAAGAQAGHILRDYRQTGEHTAGDP